MELNQMSNNITIKKNAFEVCVEQPIESDITLPEYFPDIVRVLKCSVLPNVSVVNATGDRITAEGNAVLSVLYVSDDCKMHCFEQRIPYSKFVESKNVEGCCVCARAKTEYVNCRVVSQRRLDVHGCLSITFNAYQKACQSLVRSCDEKSVQMKTSKIQCSNLRDCCEKGFNMNETIEIGASQASIGQIVRSEAVAVLSETKVVAGKILIKGQLNVKVLYLSENDNDLQRIESTMPISQIVEVDTGEDSVDILNMFVSSLEVYAKTDSSGALRLIDMTAVIRADINVYEEVEMDCVTDSYSTAYESDCKMSTVEIDKISEKFFDTYLCRGSVDLTGNNVASVLDMSCQSITANTEFSDNELCIKGTVTVSMLVCDPENEITCLERQFDYEYKRTVAQKGNAVKCIPNITATGINYLLGAENKVDIRVEIDINAVVFISDTKRVITDLIVDDSKPKCCKNAALTIYFAEEGERVWDIARKYNTTVDAIMTENKLTCDTLTEKCKLLIPSV